MSSQLLHELSTERLLLRQPESYDAEDIFLIRNDARINAYIDRAKSMSMEEAQNFISGIRDGIIDGKWLYWAICLRGKNELVGTICLWHFSDNRSVAEVGYELKPEYQGRGLMQEAFSEVLKYGFNKLRLFKIEAFTHFKNLHSRNLLERNGFQMQNKIPDAPHELVYILKNPNIASN